MLFFPFWKCSIMVTTPGHNAEESVGFEARDGEEDSCPGGERWASSFNPKFSAHKNRFRELVHIQRPRVCCGLDIWMASKAA